jgi:hypothetical protein
LLPKHDALLLFLLGEMSLQLNILGLRLEAALVLPACDACTLVGLLRGRRLLVLRGLLLSQLLLGGLLLIGCRLHVLLVWRVLLLLVCHLVLLLRLRRLLACLLALLAIRLLLVLPLVRLLLSLSLRRWRLPLLIPLTLRPFVLAGRVGLSFSVARIVALAVLLLLIVGTIRLREDSGDAAEHQKRGCRADQHDTFHGYTLRRTGRPSLRA